MIQPSELTHIKESEFIFEKCGVSEKGAVEPELRTATDVATVRLGPPELRLLSDPGTRIGPFVLGIVNLVSVRNVGVISVGSEVVDGFQASLGSDGVNPDRALLGLENVFFRELAHQESRVFAYRNHGLEGFPSPFTQEGVGSRKKGFSAIDGVLQAAMRNDEYLGHCVDSSDSADSVTDVHLFNVFQASILHPDASPCNKARAATPANTTTDATAATSPGGVGRAGECTGILLESPATGNPDLTGLVRARCDFESDDE